MAEEKAVNPLAGGGDHDKVTMLSLKADGTVDQFNPEIIGDKDTAIAAAKVQFAQQAVAAIDEEKRTEVGLAGPAEGDTSDTAIDALKAEHDKAASSAEKAAEATIDALYQDPEPAPKAVTTKAAAK